MYKKKSTFKDRNIWVSKYLGDSSFLRLKFSNEFSIQIFLMSKYIYFNKNISYQKSGLGEKHEYE